MTGNQEISTVPLPAIIIDPGIIGDDRAAIEFVEKAASTNPDLLQSAADIYSEGPEVVSSMLDFLHKHPDGVETLEAMARVMDRRLDMEITFDRLTEEAIEGDPYYASAIKDFQQSGDERLRNKFRMRRMRLFINRNRDAA